MTQLVLETPRLILRPFVEADLDAMARIYADPAVTRFISDGAPFDRFSTWRQIVFDIGHMQLRGYARLAVVEKVTGQLLGRSGMWYPEGFPALEVTWVIDHERWGEGFATEAARACLDHCWNVLGVERVCSIIRPRNAPSIRVASKLGANLERILPDFLGAPAEMYVHPRP
ncbi:MAG TPA: GNAT family N-acetyltransferase [Candidatus Dormibacteraeota bacterium]